MSKVVSFVAVLYLWTCLSHGENFLEIRIEAKHLDYSNFSSLVKTIARNPDRSVGHAWIYLDGVLDGRRVVVEGGHSGELGEYQPRYFDGIMDYIDCGVSDPVKYLWAIQRDGFFQQGSGKHKATYAAAISLTDSQFRDVLDFVNNYDYSRFSLVENQCCSFVARVAELGGLKLEHKITLPIQQRIRLGREVLTLWHDPRYSSITFSSPDVLERSLKNAVQQCKAKRQRDKGQ